MTGKQFIQRFTLLACWWSYEEYWLLNFMFFTVVGSTLVLLLIYCVLFVIICSIYTFHSLLSHCLSRGLTRKLRFYDGALTIWILNILSDLIVIVFGFSLVSSFVVSEPCGLIWDKFTFIEARNWTLCCNIFLWD